jgi:hypothetical protein
LLFGLSFVVTCATPCGGGPPAPEPLVLDVPLGEGEARCGPVTRATELIGGDGAYGTVGRTWRCYNSRVRLLVQDDSRPIGNSTRGGNLIDLDLVRDSEEDEGHDVLREHAVAFGANEVRVESIQVLKDGREGGEAILRVTGEPTDLSQVPQLYFLKQAMPATVHTDYILRPDVPYVEIKTTVVNESEDFIGPLVYLDLLSFGGTGGIFTPEHGWELPPLFAGVTFVASAGGDDRTSYAYVCPDVDPKLPLTTHAVTAVSCRDDIQIGIEETYSRFLVVGDGSVESVAREAWALRGTAVGTVSGVSSAGAYVTALTGGGPDDDDAFATNRTRAGADGAFTLTLPVGEYALVAHREGAARGAPVAVTVSAGETTSADVPLGDSGALRVTTSFSARDGAALGALPALLSVQALDDTQRASAALGDWSEHGLVRYAPSSDGTFTLDLPAGRYRVYVSRGFEFTRFEQDVTIVAGEQVSVDAALRHVVDTDGLVAAELHQHSLGSLDSNTAIPVKVLENAAAGIELAVSSEHDNIVDFAPHVDALGLAGHLVALPGNEVSYESIGHFNAYPWAIDADDPFRDVGSRLWFGKNVPGVFEAIRAATPDPIVQINHPRLAEFGYFLSLRLDPSSATRFARAAPTLPLLPDDVYSAWTSAFDAVEVNGELGDVTLYTPERAADLSALSETDPASAPVFADWLALLGAGLPVAATGSSDTHFPGEGVGYPRTFLRTDEASGDSLRESIRRQRTAVGQGCLAELFVGDQRPMGVGEAVAPADLTQLRLRVQAPPHVGVERVELYVNGHARGLAFAASTLSVDDAGALSLPLDAAWATDEVVRLDAPVGGLGAGDLVVVAVARGGSGLSPTGGGETYCYSAPLYVDDGGDGWTGWLEASQDVR